MFKGEVIPTRRVLSEAEAENRRLGHENLGFLSEAHGFLPSQPPRLSLPASHGAWDERARQLPEMFRTLTLRQELARMPVLDAGHGALPEGDLYRAAAILGIFAHAYHYVEAAAYERIPDSILSPWEVVSQRLSRPAPHLSFIDLNIYNWRLLDAQAPDPMRVENLQLLIPIVGNEDERRFQCTPIEMVAGFTPVVMAVVRAQEAAHRDDPDALERELVCMRERLNALTFTSFMKVNPNAESPLHVDPVVWGKTVAPLATPFQGKHIPGPSGTAIPTFTLMDIFFGRNKFSTSVGHETERTRAWFPPHWQAFLIAAEQVSVPDYVAKRGRAELSGSFHQAMEAYSGEAGMIGRHRIKAYGFLDLSFKVGRNKTLGGFDGGFQDRLWDRMDDQLEYARKERYGRHPESCHFVRIKQVQELSGAGAASVRRVILDTRGTGIRYQPGDRCAILPENSDELVDKTLQALAATGDEPIPLTGEWRAAMQLRDGYRDARVLSLRTLLTFGRIRPVSRTTAKVLHAITHNEALHRVIEARAEDQWELWDLLQLLTDSGFNPKRLRKAAPGEREHIARLVPPETYRMYSISSVMGGEQADEIHLTIGQLSYHTEGADVSRAARRTGTCSAFLGRLIDSPKSTERRLSIKVVHPPRFDLPADPRRPVVMFAGGTGVAPFLGMLEARAAQAGGGENWLFYATRTRGEFHDCATWERLCRSGRLNLQSVFSRDDARAQFDGKNLRFEPGLRSRIDREMLSPGNAERLSALAQAGAHFYVCGRTGFAKSVMTAMQTLLGGEAGVAAGREQLYRLVGEDRYLQEIFTTYPGAQFLERKLFHASEIVLHNDPQHGYWMVIGGRVYDVTEFARMHAGGHKIMQSYAGMDATVAYRRAQHDVNPEVDSLTGMFEIGAVQRLHFGSEWGAVVSPKGLKFVALSDLYEAFVRFLYAVVEMENALQNDHSISVEQVTYDEQRGSARTSPYRLQLRMQTHERFMRDYLSAVTGPALEHLWTITCGLCSERLDSRWIMQELQVIEATVAARTTRGLTWERVVPCGADAAGSLSALAELTDALAEEDRRFLNEAKLALRRGVQVFESLEQHSLTQGRRPLVESVRGLPRVLSDYYTRVAERVGAESQRYVIS